MKKFIFLITILISGFAFSQVKEEMKTDSEIYEKVDRASEFPGGINAFRKKIADNFRGRKVLGVGLVRCEISFIIENDGRMSNIKANGSNDSFNVEAIRAVSKINDKWSSAKVNGEKVRSFYRIPLTMRF